MPSIAKSLQLVKNMGTRYVFFRIGHELKNRTGFFKRKFPQNPPPVQYTSLEEWRKSFKFWGVTQQEEGDFQPTSIPNFDDYRNGKIPFFSSEIKDLGPNYDWLTNPDSGHKYAANQHWSQIADYSQKNGDIKYVWEKSRFSYLYAVIRHDFYKEEDHSEWVFDEIRSWLKANPINSGPNYRCSQEISLRVLNWTYALNFYKDSSYLTEELFNGIMHAIYWQMKHVYANINFSRIAVRNNHAITETLTLYLAGLFFPFFPEAKKWKKQGKKWFEQEIEYQIYPDGTFLQFSMNYHRVVIQLFTWALKSADYFEEKFNPVVYERAYKSINFLFTCQDKSSGWLPNYGSNDGALFFPLNACGYRDYRPQLSALHLLLTGTGLYSENGDWEEDAFWFKAKKAATPHFDKIIKKDGWKSFPDGGYYVLREQETVTFIRCGNHKDRPAQADNLHMDVWHKGENVLFDGGSYKYNTDPETLKYFMGTESHNTVMLNGFDQMQKGARFIWYNWTQAKMAEVTETETEYIFEGEISAFTYLNPTIVHRRVITKGKKDARWEIKDEIKNKPQELKMKQYWHSLPTAKIKSFDDADRALPIQKETGWRSEYYGQKTAAAQYLIETNTNSIETKITI